MTDSAAHWAEAWNNRDPATTSWFEGANCSDAAEVLADGIPESVVDIGAGQSRLVDHLLAAGVEHVTLLDIAAAPLDAVRERLDLHHDVQYVVSSVLDWLPARTYSCWHDRATFHFLTDPADQLAYAELAARAVEPGGRLVVAGFAVDGPEQCSGLDVARHDEAGLASIFASGFALVHTTEHRHLTPWEAEQHFLCATFRRR
jgi:SAM-dependent methyltransferase